MVKQFKHIIFFCVLMIVPVLLANQNKKASYPSSVGRDMTKVARNFLAELNSDQKTLVHLSLKDSDWERWHYIPSASRKGIQLKELTMPQQKMVLNLLRAALSDGGFQKTEQIISLENVLREMEGSTIRDPGLYYVAIFGSPKIEKTWAWQFEGHHLSFNFMIHDGEVVGLTPSFFGANPAVSRSKNGAVLQPLKQEEEMARSLVNSMSRTKRKQAIFRTFAYWDILTGGDSEVSPLDSVGIRVKDMNKNEENLLKKLIEVYLGNFESEIVEKQRRKVFNENWKEVRFGWAGSTKVGEKHYYRIQGKSFLIEYDNRQNGANHIHSVWHDFKNNFGRSALKHHYNTAPHHKKEVKKN